MKKSQKIAVLAGVVVTLFAAVLGIYVNMDRGTMPQVEEKGTASEQIRPRSLVELRSMLLMQAIKSDAFYTLESPDKKWTLIEMATTTYVRDCDQIRHQLLLKSAVGEPARLLVSRTESSVERDGRCYRAKSEEDWNSWWQPIGWSADGKFVYHTRYPEIPMGDAEPIMRLLGMSLYRVDVKSGQSRRLFGTLDTSKKIVDILDVHPLSGKMVWAEQAAQATVGPTVFAGTVAGGNRVALMTLDVAKEERVAYAVISPDGKKAGLMLSTYKTDRKEGEESYAYSLAVFDLLTRKKQDVALSVQADEAWILSGWKDAQTVQIKKASMSSHTEVDIEDLSVTP